MSFNPDPISCTIASASECALATSVLQLCTLCEELLALAEYYNPDLPRLVSCAEQLEAVRANAAPLALRDAAPSADDLYSLPTLGQWVWRE